MAKIKKATSSMPRGDSRTITLAIPTATYTPGAKIFFTLKSSVDNVLDDSTAVLKKTLTDADIQSSDLINVNYLLSLTPTDTNSIVPANYFAEFEFVSADGTQVTTFPEPTVQLWKFNISGDVTRRIT